MDTIASLAGDRADDMTPSQACSTPANTDFAGVSLGQVCDAYASEELQRRMNRTEIMIARALSQAD